MDLAEVTGEKTMVELKLVKAKYSTELKLIANRYQRSEGIVPNS